MPMMPRVMGHNAVFQWGFTRRDTVSYLPRKIDLLNLARGAELRR